MAAITLDDVVLEQMETNETLGNLKEQTIIMFQMQNQGLGTLISQFEEFLGMVRTQMRLAEEARREQSVLPPLPSLHLQRVTVNQRWWWNGIRPRHWCSIHRIREWCVAGFYAMIRKNFKGITTAIEGFVKFIRRQLLRVGTFFKGIGTRIIGFFDFSKGAATLGESLTKATQPIRDFFKKIKNNPIVKFFGALGGLVGRLAYPIFLASISSKVSWVS